MARSSNDVPPDQINMVGEGTVFEGTLRAESNVRVSGHIKGTLDVQGRAILTQEGVVEGELRATDADVAGSVQGEIHVSERLMLKSTARVDGNIETGRIKVEEGALFAGQCEIGEQVNEKVQKQIGEKGPSASSSGSGSGARSGQASRSDGASGSSSSKKSSSKSSSSKQGASGGKGASGAPSKKAATGK